MDDLFTTPRPAAARRAEPAMPAGEIDPRAGRPLRCGCGAWAPYGRNHFGLAGRIGTWTCGPTGCKTAASAAGEVTT